MINSARRRGGDDELSALIRAQMRDPANRQHLSRLPDFRVDTKPSEIFSDLLKRLDRAEESSRHTTRD